MSVKSIRGGHMWFAGINAVQKTAICITNIQHASSTNRPINSVASSIR